MGKKKLLEEAMKLDDLNKDVLSVIVKSLNDRDLGKLAQVNKLLNKVAATEKDVRKRAAVQAFEKHVDEFIAKATALHKSKEEAQREEDDEWK